MFAMNQQIDNAQKLGKEGMETMLRTFSNLAKGSQAIAVEAADFAKQSFEQGTATMEKLAGARSLDKVIEIQSEYVKLSYERLVAQAGKMNELYANLAKEAMKPAETATARVQAAA